MQFAIPPPRLVVVKQNFFDKYGEVINDNVVEHKSKYVNNFSLKLLLISYPSLSIMCFGCSKEPSD